MPTIKRKTILGIVFALMSFVSSSVILFAYNPLIYQQYTADPTASWFNNRMYIYCSHDITGQTSYVINNVYLMSSDDLVNWTDEGVPVAASNTSWAGSTYAPDSISRNGYYYIYYGNGGGSIGVFRSTSPTGPFTDPLGKAMITSSTAGVAPITYTFDPAAFIDDDGQAYIYFGGGGPGNARVIKLNSDMISVSGSAVSIDAYRYFEAPFMNKVNGTYYFTYSTDFSASPAASIDYLTSSSPMTGFTHRGTVLYNPPNNCGNNNHASIVNIGTDYYMAYHNRALAILDGLTCAGNAVYQRSVNLDRLYFNSDGTIAVVTPTTAGVTNLKNQDPYTTLRAVMMAKESGIQTTTCSEGGLAVTNIENGDWIQVRNLDFGSGAATFTARVASAVSGGSIQIRLGGTTGTLVGTCSVPNTGGASTWQSVSCPVTGATDLHDVYFVFAGGSGTLFNFEWYVFTQAATATSTFTPTPTWTRTSTSTFSSTPTRTFTPTNTLTSTATATRTSTATWSRTSTPTFTSTSTPTATATLTRTSTPTLTWTPTSTNTSTSTSTVTRTFTFTSTPTASSTATGTATPTFTFTSTMTKTYSSTPSLTLTPTAIATSTLTATSSFTRTSTSTSTPTDSPVWTSTATPTSSSTTTSTKTWTVTVSFTETFTSTLTKTPTLISTSTPTSTATTTSSNTPSSTVTRIWTATLTSTPMDTLTSTSTWTSTATQTFTTTATNSFTKTYTATMTFSSTPTQTWVDTSTDTKTPTSTASSTRTATPTSTSTSSNTPTATYTFTLTPTETPVWTATSTPTPSTTTTETSTSSPTPSATVTATSTGTPSATSSWTHTATLTPTRTNTVTFTASSTFTPTPTQTPTATLTATRTMTFTVTSTSTSTSTGTPVLTSTATPLGNTTVIVWPNPVSGGTVNVLLPAYGGSVDVRLRIFTASYRKIEDATFLNVPSGRGLQVHLADSWGRLLANGIYYVVMTTPMKTYTTKLVVLK